MGFSGFLNKETKINKQKGDEAERERGLGILAKDGEREGSGPEKDRLHAKRNFSTKNIFLLLFFFLKKFVASYYLMSFWKKIKLGTQDSFQFIPKFYFFSLSQDKVLTLNLYDHFIF